jgi:hypothetical protein
MPIAKPTLELEQISTAGESNGLARYIPRDFISQNKKTTHEGHILSN